MGFLGQNEYRTGAPGIIRNALLNIPMPVAVLEGFEMVLTYANTSFLEAWGKSTDSIGKRLSEFLPELYDQRYPALLRQVLLSGNVFEESAAYSYVFKDGERQEMYFDYSYSPVRDEEGAVIGVMIVANDVTEGILAKKKLQESEQRFGSLLKDSPVPTALLTGSEFTISITNNAALQLWGKTKKVIGKPITEAIPELINQSFIDNLNKVLKTGDPYYGKEEAVSFERDGKLEVRYLNFNFKAVNKSIHGVEEILMVGYDVTDQVEARLRAEQASYDASMAKRNLEMALGAGQMGYFELDLTTGFINGTPQCNTNYGLTSTAKLFRNDILNEILPQYRPYIEEQLNEAFKNHSYYHAQYEIKWPDNSIHWIKESGYAKYDDFGTPTVLCGVTIDITEDIKAEERRAVLASIIDSSDDMILSKTLQGIITSWNPAAKRMFGYEEHEVIGKHISILIPPHLLHQEELIIGNIAKGRSVDHFETTRLTKDGREISISLSVSPIRDSAGKVIGASKIARDISESKRTQEKQAILAAIVDSSDDTILSKTLKGIITSWNPAAQRMFGYTEEEAIGQHISMLIPPNHLHEEDIIISNIASGNKVDHFETVRVTKDGREIDVSLTISPIRDASGKVIGASKIARDITAQKKAEKDLKRYAETLETINKLCRMISEELDQEKLLQRITDAATQVTGAEFGALFYYKPAETGEKMMLYTLSGASREDFEKFGMPRNTAVFHTTLSGEAVFRSDDITRDSRYGKNYPHTGIPEGHLPVKSYLAAPLISNSGTVIGGLFLGHKHSAIFTKEHESIVVAIASQAAVALDNARLFEEVKVLNTKKDEFIGLASHELKTPLTSMSGYLQILKRVETNEKHQSFIQKTIYQADKLSTLVNEMLDVSKIEAGKLQFNYENFNLCKLLAECTEQIQLATTTHTIEFKGCGDVFIRGDKDRLEQLLINLLTNAIKYSPKADRVEVLLEDEGERIRFGVKDYGIGIAQDKIQHLFSRFYRVDGLNPGMSGLGIGLYIAKEIVDRHQGSIWVDTEEGKGSTFWVTLNKAGTL